MKRIFGIGTIGLAAALLGAGAALAQPAGEGPRRERGERPQQQQREGQQRGERPQQGQGEAVMRPFARLFEGIELTADQRTAAREIAVKHQEAVAAWREKHAEELEAIEAEMRKAREDRNREAMQAAREKLQKLTETRPRPDTVFGELRGLLSTEADKAKFDENVAAARERMEQRRQQAGEGERPRQQREGAQQRPAPRGEGGQRGGDRPGPDI